MKKLLPLILLIAIVQGCLPTLHPLYHPKDLLQIEGLTGNWVMNPTTAKSYKWHFEPNPDAKDDDEMKNIYFVNITSEKDSAVYAGGILKLDNTYYLDLYLVDFESDLPMIKDHLYPVHSVWKFDFKPDKIEIYPFNSSWIRDMVKNNQFQIKHEKTEKGLLITAATDELQAFVKKYGSDKRAFDKPSILNKVE